MTDMDALVMLLRVVVVFLIALFWLLCFHFPKLEFFRWWTAAWMVFGLHLAFGALAEATDIRVFFLNQLVAGYIQSPLLVMGARRYERPIHGAPRKPILLSLLAAAAAGLLFYWLSTTETGPRVQLIQNLPRKLLLAAALGYCVWACLRRWVMARSWSALANAFAFAISSINELASSIDWGYSVSQIPFPGMILRPAHALALHQFGLGLTWPFVVSLGMILLLLEEHRRMEVAEAVSRKTREEVERNFAKAVRSSLDAITISDLDTGRYVEANDAFLRLTGYEKNEVVGHTALELGLWDPPQDRDVFVAGLRESGSVQNFELRMRKRDGSTATMITSAELLDLQGSPHVLSMSKDITDRKRAEQELRASEARFRQLADSMPQMVWTARSNGEIDYYNQGWRDYTGCSADDPGHTGWRNALHPDDADRCEAGWQSAIESGKPFQIEHRLRSGRGAFRWFLTRAVPVPDEAGRIAKWFGTSTDIDDQKKTQEVLRLANEDLNQFAYSASHTLQEPVKNVAVYAEILARRYDKLFDEDAKYCIRIIVEGARHIRSLIRDVLEYTRVGAADAGAVGPTDANAALDDALIGLRASIQESGATIVRNGLPNVPIRKVHLQQLFQNLIENAIKYRANTPPHIEVRAECARGQWRISVSDNGIGIEPQYAQQIFGLFKRLHGPEQPGTGIGLAICKKIIERYGGNIWVESELGNGATFFFTLPACDSR